METTKGYGMKENLYDVITGGPEAAENFFKGKKNKYWGYEWEIVTLASYKFNFIRVYVNPV